MSTRFSKIAIRRLVFVGAVAIASGAAAAAVPQSEEILGEAIRPGEVADIVRSLHAPDQTFAVYLPSEYTPERTWPALFLMDPRGRARVPLELFRPAAERLGYVLVSSYNTASDVSEDVNSPALEAMLTDGTRLFALDNRRFYLGGFSGTARLAWEFAEQLQASVAGIVAFGGGVPGGFVLPDEAGYAYYGAAGTTDFNYDEMRTLDRRLDGGGIAHRFEYFIGGHSWGPEEVCTRALEWMELQAMKARLRAPVRTLAADLYTRRVLEAQAWESRARAAPPSAGNPAPGAGSEDPVVDQRAIDTYEAWLRYSALLVDFDGVIGRSELDRIADRVRAFGELVAVADVAGLTDRLTARHRAFVEELGTVVQQLRAGDRQIDGAELIQYLDLERIKRQAADFDSPMRALAGQRLIESVFVLFAYYQPRDYLAQGDPAAALELLEVADFLRPDSFNVLLFQARAYAQNGDSGQAVETLRRAHAIRELDASALGDDPYFDPIRGAAGFLELIAQLRAPARQPR
ncbi:MAG TPA: hypothetical protein QGG47_11075 [Acidobacteriota bacterium]|nr:hypothetical protein [Acidobacteriota bacterium]